MKESDEANLSALCEEYAVDISILEKTIVERLLSAYEKETAKADEIKYETISLLLPIVKDISWRGKTVIAVDVFSMEHESRLLLAGIHDGHFVGNELASADNRNLSVRVLVCVSAIKEIIYDTIYLVHMMTSFSNTNFEMYNSPFAAGKFIYADERNLMSAHLLDESHALSVMKQENPAVAVDMRSRIGNLCTQENALTHKIDSLLEGYTYMQSLLSSRHDWLTGHFTEQMIPEDLFRSLCDSCQFNDDLVSRIGTLLMNAAPKARLLIYRSAFDKLTVSGELDFFNQRVMLSGKQQMECILYVRQLAEKGCVRIIDGGFSSDFQHVSDPCIFLADSVDYLRLENGTYKNNLRNITDRELRNVFHDFFDEIWEDDSSIVIKENEAVMKIIDLYITV